MVADDTALILVLPDDGAESVMQKVAQSGSNRVQLLVPEGVAALQNAAGTDRLAQLAAAAGVELLLISSDQATLGAARGSKLQTMLVQNAHVVAPPRPAAQPAPSAPLASPTSPYATRVLEQPVAPTAPPAAPAAKRPVDDLSEGDAAFLQALDDFDAAPAPRPRATTSQDDDVYEALESLSAALDEGDRRPTRPGAASTPDNDLADALDSIGAEQPRPERRPTVPRVRAEDIQLSDDEVRRANRPERRPTPSRVRAEDVQLSDDELRRAHRPERRASAAPSAPLNNDDLRRANRPEWRASPPPTAPRRAARSQATPARASARPAEAPARRQRGLPIFWIVLGLLLLLVVIGAVLLLGGNGAVPAALGGATVTVSAPVRSDTIEPIVALPLPIAAPANAGNTAVSAEAIGADVPASATGTVTEGTFAPVGTAGGVVSIFSDSPQAIQLPAGTEFVALRADGQEVPFTSIADVVLPPATTSDNGAQIVTTRGQASVQVAARSPGSGSNVDPNSIQRMTPPGGQTFTLGSGALRVQHDALLGGSEQEVRIVKDVDVQRVLGEALSRLDSEATRQLNEQAVARGLAVDPTTLSPRREDLERLQGFEYTVSPGVGQTLDPANPSFTLNVQARYSALATPPDQTIQQTIPLALNEQLRQSGALQPGDCRAPFITGWRWDGTQLLVDGEIRPDTQNPRCNGGLDAAALTQVREAVRGTQRAEAEAALQNLVAQGVIGSYSLPPNLQTLPGWDWQLRIEAR